MPRRSPKENSEGDVENLGSSTVTHHFVDAPGAVIPIRWHYVEAGDPKNETLVFLHGNPESWEAWSEQIPHFARNYHIIAPDLKGYGQGDKRPGDWRWESVAVEFASFLEKIGVTKSHVVAHDRGAVLADYFAGNNPNRVLSYVRMQQICHILYLDNSPQSVYFADPIFGPNIYGDPDFYYEYRLKKMLKNPVPAERIEKLKEQMSFPGLNTAVIRYFQSSSFEKERLDRTARLFRKMTFPVMILQGDRDDGQPPLYFNDETNPAVDQFPNARLRWVEGAGHYTHMEKPEVVTERIDEFLRSVARPG